jgi:hypothetical protein
MLGRRLALVLVAASGAALTWCALSVWGLVPTLPDSALLGGCVSAPLSLTWARWGW